MKKIILISSSLRKESLSFLLINKADKILKQKELSSKIIDLKEESIPFCDGRPIENYPKNIQKIYKTIKESNYIIFGMPVYCYSVSGVLKNFIDIFSQAFKNKYFGICCATGSKLSYLATSDLLKILHFESKSIGIQPIVMADESDFDKNQNINNEIEERMIQMINNLLIKKA